MKFPANRKAFALFREILSEVGIELEPDHVLPKISIDLDPSTRTVSLVWWDFDDTDFKEIEALLQGEKGA